MADPFNPTPEHRELRRVVRELAGRAATPSQLSLLIEAYRRTGDRSAAIESARQFVERYPNDSRAPRLRTQYLGERAGGTEP